MKKVTTKKIEPSKWVNTETGEHMDTAFPGVTSVKQVNQELVIMHSEEYVIIDSKALQYVRKNFSTADYGRILEMADMTRGSFNLLFDGDTAHTDESLMVELRYVRSKYSAFMKRLLVGSVIYYIEGYVDGKKRRSVMLNPHFARKRKTIHQDCLSAFDNIRKIDTGL